MIRIVIISLLIACRTAAPPPPVEKPYLVKVEHAPPPPPVNLICKKFAAIDKAATCEPELTDVGPTHIYTASVTYGGQMLACRQDTNVLGMMCGAPITDVRPVPPTQDAKPDAKPAPAAKKAPPKK